MSELRPEQHKIYHVFLASPGDCNPERQAVRSFFDEYNRTTANPRNLHFTVIDWENHATAGVGRPQELITQQTLERYKSSLALVIGIMAQRFGSPTGKAESGTEEEFNCALTHHHRTGWPEIKFFFHKLPESRSSASSGQACEEDAELARVRAFKNEVARAPNELFYKEYDPPNFAHVLSHDLTLWLNHPDRPWNRRWYPGYPWYPWYPPWWILILMALAIVVCAALVFLPRYKPVSTPPPLLHPPDIQYFPDPVVGGVSVPDFWANRGRLGTGTEFAKLGDAVQVTRKPETEMFYGLTLTVTPKSRNSWAEYLNGEVIVEFLPGDPPQTLYLKVEYVGEDLPHWESGSFQLPSGRESPVVRRVPVRELIRSQPERYTNRITRVTIEALLSEEPHATRSFTMRRVVLRSTSSSAPSTP